MPSGKKKSKTKKRVAWKGKTFYYYSKEAGRAVAEKLMKSEGVSFTQLCQKAIELYAQTKERMRSAQLDEAQRLATQQA